MSETKTLLGPLIGDIWNLILGTRALILSVEGGFREVTLRKIILLVAVAGGGCEVIVFCSPAQKEFDNRERHVED